MLDATQRWGGTHLLYPCWQDFKKFVGPHWPRKIGKGVTSTVHPALSLLVLQSQWRRSIGSVCSAKFLEETDAAAADDLYDPYNASDDAEDDDDDDDDEDDDDDDDDVMVLMMKMLIIMMTVQIKHVVFWNDDDAISHAGCAKSLSRCSGVLIFYSHHGRFYHGREPVVNLLTRW